MGVAWQTALGAVFISGVVFFFLTLFGLRQLIIAAIPVELHAAVAAGVDPDRVVPEFAGLLATLRIHFGYFGALPTHIAVLVLNTAIPVWQHSRRWLPPLFAASARLSRLTPLTLHSPKATRTMALMCGTAGQLAETVLGCRWIRLHPLFGNLANHNAAEAPLCCGTPQRH